jgi:protein SCO1
MKTSLLVVSGLLAALPLTATAQAGVPDPATKPSCCAAQPAAAPAACCAPEKPSAPAACCAEEKAVAPLSAKSIYQLDARWTDDAGRELSLTSFRGKPVVVAMFFAQCEYACPVIVQDMQRLRALLPEAVREKTQFVLVTFDTARDTVPALKAYRERMKLDASWTLLRSDPANVQELAMVLGVKFKQDARGQFAHSNVITILNPDGEIAHQHAGLNGDVSQAAKTVALAR